MVAVIAGILCWIFLPEQEAVSKINAIFIAVVAAVLICTTQMALTTAHSRNRPRLKFIRVASLPVFRQDQFDPFQQDRILRPPLLECQGVHGLKGITYMATP